MRDIMEQQRDARNPRTSKTAPDAFWVGGRAARAVNQRLLYFADDHIPRVNAMHLKPFYE